MKNAVKTKILQIVYILFNSNVIKFKISLQKILNNLLLVAFAHITLYFKILLDNFDMYKRSRSEKANRMIILESRDIDLNFLQFVLVVII